MGASKTSSLITEAERRKLKKFGLIIRNEREKRGWTLEDTEDHGFRTWQHWSAIELGKKNINFTTILKICKVLKISPKVLWSKM